jgi:hypothetical protein
MALIHENITKSIIVVALEVTKVYRTKDEAQLLNELEATVMEVGLLINFGAEK